MNPSFLSKHKLVFGIICLCLVLFIGLINFFAPRIVENYYQAKDFDDLNRLVNSRTVQPLEFYLGEVEEKWSGPLTNILSHMLLGLFCFLFGREWSFKKYLSVIFLFLIVTKFNVLCYPPYGDAIGGPFAEAIWLKNHHFNYVGLFQQPTYNLGGPKVYFFSIYPTYLALLYTLIPWVKWFLAVNHLVVFFLSAYIISLIREISARMFDARSAILSSIVLLALPLFQSQTEAINMELPCLFFSVLSVYALINKSIGRATLFAFLSLLVKGHGILVCGTVVIISLFLLFYERKGKKKWPYLFYSFLMIFSILLKVFSKFLLNDQHVSAGMVKFLAGWPSLKIMYLLQIFGASLFVLTLVFIWDYFKIKNIRELLLKKYYAPLVIVVASLMWFALFINFYAVSPRYKLALAPYLVLCVITAVLNLPFMKEAYRWTALSCGIIATALGSYGFYHVPLGANYHIFLERSLEYRSELKMNRLLVQTIETEYKEKTISAPFLMAQMLAIPDLGYVREPLNVMVYGMNVTYGNIKNFEGLKKEDIMRTIWIGLAADYMDKGNLTYPVHAKDKVLQRIIWGRNWAEIFVGGFAVEQRRQILNYIQMRQQFLKGL